MARLAHLDADAFFYAVELARNPGLAGQPVMISGASPRAVVATASYEARQFGVRSGMSAVRARALCPQIMAVRPDFPAYRETSQRIWQLAQAALGPMELLGLDEAFADLQGLERPLAVLRRLVADIHQATGITVSVGVGPNRLVAKLASDCDKPNGFTVLTRAQAVARFRDQPPGIVPGIGPKTQAALAALGVHTLGRLQQCPEALLGGRFSARSIQELKARAQLHGGETITTVRERKSRSAEATFPADLHDVARMEAELELLAARVAADLQRRGQAGATVGLKVRLPDFTTFTRDRTLAHPTQDATLIGQLAVRLLHDSLPEQGVRLLGVRVGGLDRLEAREAVQLSLF